MKDNSIQISNNKAHDNIILFLLLINEHKLISSSLDNTMIIWEY